jgi:hypothetical protein
LKSRRIAVVVGCAALVLLAIVFRNAIARVGLEAVLSVATGSRVTVGWMHLGGDASEFGGIRVERGGKAMFTADRVAVRYRLRDLLPGGKRRYGLEAVELDKPALTVHRDKNGVLDILGPQKPGAKPRAGAPAAQTPLRMTVRVRDGLIAFEDPFRSDPVSRRFAIERLTGDGTIDTAGRTHYGVSGDYLAEGVRYPLTVRGISDFVRGFSLHVARANAMPLRELANYFINGRVASLSAGEARHLRVRMYALGDGPYHLSANLNLNGLRLAVAALQYPLADLSGHVEVFDDGLFAPRLTATLNGGPLLLGGGLFHFADPRIAMGVRAAGPLHRLASLFAFSARQPLGGDMTLRVLLEGPVGDPLILTRLQSGNTLYRALPIANVDGTVAYYRSTILAVPFDARYGGIDVSAHGAFLIGPHLITEAAARADAPASAVPYIAQAVPAAQLRATGLIAGLDGAFAARGVMHAAGGGDALDGFFHIGPHGDGEFGPVLATRADGSSAAGALILDRPHSRSAFWLDARRFAMAAPATPPQLPGLPQVRPPSFAAAVDVSVAGFGPPSGFAIAGTLATRNLLVGGVHIDAAQARVTGSPADARLSAIRADGPWGTFAGAGALKGSDLALRGEYHGSFTRLESFTGRLGAVGDVAAPMALVVGPGPTIVQTTGARTPGATVHGIPIDGLAGTLAAGKQGVRVYAARALVAHAPLAAAGAVSGPGTLGLAVANAEAARLAGIGLPLAAGTISAVGGASFAAAGIRFEGGAIVRNGRYAEVPVAGNGDVDLRGSVVRFGRVDGRIGTVHGSAQGVLTHIDSHTPRYDVALRVRGADLGDAAASFGVRRYYLDGSADADLHVGGEGGEPSVTGRVELPEATVNGLFIDHAAGKIRAAPTSVALDDTLVTVGSTTTRISGSYQRRSVALAVDSPRANLTDFDNFFDDGDMLAGTGHVVIRFRRERGRPDTGGNLGLAGLRLGHFDFGNAAAAWRSAGSRVRGQAGFDGRLGRLDATGSIDLAVGGTLRRLVSRSDFDLKTHAQGVDLGAWLPALGYTLPVGGKIDADGTLRGRFPALALSGNARLVNGTIGKLPVDHLSVSASSSVSRTTINDAQIEVGTITARASGSFGYRPTDPLQLAVHASSPNIGTVVSKLTGETVPIAGAFEADLRASGRPAHPTVTGGFDIEKATLAGVAVPRALGEVSISGRDVVLRDTEVAFARGTLYLAGSLPLTLSPFGFGPAAAPIGLEAQSSAVNLENFVPLLPKGSVIQGTLNGRVALRGTVAAPSLDGALSLAGGALLAPGFEQQPISGIDGSVTFAGTTARLERLHAEAGGGTIDLQGSASLPNLIRPGDASYDVDLRLVRARLNFPEYGRGQIDGNLALHHAPGSLATVSGEATLQDAVIPFSALYNPSAGGGGDELALTTAATTPFGLPNVAFDLGFTAGRNVRVRSSVIDIGAAGTVRVGGTLADPRLSGAFAATGGTLTYFNTVFRLQDAVVTFEPGQGIVPVIDARATTHVFNPDPNLERNPVGSADITFSVKGPVTNLNIGLDSNPSYDRSQILGLLLSAPAIGATSLFATPVLPGSPPPLAISTTNPNGSVTIGQTAFGVLNAQFTRNLLSPIESSLGGALGLSNVNFTFDYTGGVGVSARKLLGKDVYAVYGTTFGYPYRQTFGFELRPSPTTAAQFTFFETIGAVYGYVTSPITGAVSRVTLSEPITGTTGFSFSLQKFFW